MARLVPARRRAHVGPAGPQGRDLLRYRARTRSPGRAGRATAARSEPLPRHSPRAGPGRAGLDRHDDRPRSHPAAGRRRRPDPAAGLVCAPRDRRTNCPLPHLPLPARPRRRLGRRRAHRLRTAHDPGHRRPRRPRGTRSEWVDRRAVGSGGVRRQPRRHARPDDRGTLPVDAAPRRQPDRAHQAVVPVLHRPVMGCGRPADAARRQPAARRRSPPLGRHERAGVGRDVRRMHLMAKVAKVFPALAETVRPSAGAG